MTALPRSRRLALYLACATALLPWPAAGEIYKWVDENGVVNYGESPPQNRQSKVVDVERARLSVYTPAPASNAPADQRLSQQIDRLERELASKRSEADADAQRAAERELQRLERCRMDRRVDCDEVVLEDYPPAVIYAPPAYWKPHRPPIHAKPAPRPRPLPREEPREAPRPAPKSR
jgi:hypothetical protein